MASDEKREHVTIKERIAKVPDQAPGYLNGTWYNQLGSTVELTQSEDGLTVTGEYHTAVVEEGDHGEDGVVRGTSAPKKGTFGFSVYWSDEAAVASWAGQYFKRDGQEILETTWILTGAVEHHDRWKANNVGMDRFTRHKQV